ncbi:MAG: chemotaxis protein CheW [Syntrophothermus sp.]
MKNQHRVVLFTIESRRFALRLDCVERVIRAAEITSLPKAPDIVMGIINIHGEVVPVVNIRRRFSLPERNISVNDQIIIITTPRRKFCFFADSVSGYAEISSEEVINEEKLWHGIELVEGVIRLEGELVLISGLNEFFQIEEESGLNDALSAENLKDIFAFRR